MAALATIDDLKELLQVEDAKDDALLERLLEAASAWLATQCGYPNGSMTEQALVFTFSGEDTRGWTPPVLPIADVTKVTVDEVEIPEKATGVDGWYVSDAGRLELSGSYRFTRGHGNCVVEATCGFDPTAVPKDLEAAAISLAAQRFQERNRIGQVSGNVGGVQVTFSTFSAPADVNLTIQAYRLGSI